MTKQPRALVIDDDDSTRFVLSQALSDLGFDVTAADDGAVGQELVVQESFDLLVLDLYMPGMNGFELLRHLRRSDVRLLPTPHTPPGVPILVVSGEGQAASIANAKRLGANAYLVKPVDIDVFCAAVRNLLKGKTASLS
jgi:DNA-binding response OmpR family regulator